MIVWPLASFNPDLLSGQINLRKGIIAMFDRVEYGCTVKEQLS